MLCQRERERAGVSSHHRVCRLAAPSSTASIARHGVKRYRGGALASSLAARPFHISATGICLRIPGVPPLPIRLSVRGGEGEEALKLLSFCCVCPNGRVCCGVVLVRTAFSSSARVCAAAALCLSVEGFLSPGRIRGLHISPRISLCHLPRRVSPSAFVPHKV